MEVFDYLRKSIFDIDINHLTPYWEPVIIRYSVLFNFGNDYRTYLLASDGFSYRILLYGLISLSFGDRVCLVCHSSIPKDSPSSYCSSCISGPDKAYQECLFHSPQQVYSRSCSFNNFPCNYPSNLSRCFSSFYLYIGRFGDIIKVGVSHLGSGIFRFRRIIEQGLNEAFVIYPFYSLHEVTSFERFLVDEIGIDERITFVDKVNSLLDYSFTKLTYYYSPRQLKELFPAKKIKHFDFYPDNPLSSLLLHKFNIEAKRTVDTLFGNIIFTQGNVGLIKDDDMLTFFDISNLSGRIIRRG